MRRAQFIAVLLLGLGVLVAAIVLLPVVDWALWVQSWAALSGWRGQLAFIAIFALWNLLLPPLPLQLVAGFCWGFWGGLGVIYAGATLAQLGAFGLTRTLARERVRAWLGQRTLGLAIERAIEARPFRMVLLLRLAGILPSSVVNYLIGLAPIGLGTALLASWCGKLPGVSLSVLAGLGGGAALLGGEGTGVWGVAAFISALGFGIIASWWFAVVLRRDCVALRVA